MQDHTLAIRIEMVRGNSVACLSRNKKIMVSQWGYITMKGKHKCNEKYSNREMAARRVVKSKVNDVRNLRWISSPAKNADIAFLGEHTRWTPNKSNTTPSSWIPKQAVLVLLPKLKIIFSPWMGTTNQARRKSTMIQNFSTHHTASYDSSIMVYDLISTLTIQRFFQSTSLAFEARYTLRFRTKSHLSKTSSPKQRRRSK